MDIKNIYDILRRPEEYIDGSKYLSWERFFTDLLESSTKDDLVRKYQKSSLNSFYLEGRNRDEIIKVLPDEILSILTEDGEAGKKKREEET